jgi:hypothetical protein
LISLARELCGTGRTNSCHDIAASIEAGSAVKSELGLPVEAKGTMAE